MQFLMIVDDPQIAAFVASAGVDRLFVDLEYIGKDVRQKNVASWKSKQTSEDVSKIRKAAPDAHLLVRINPLHDGTAQELDDVIARGADSVMLPMFSTTTELAQFYDLLDDRVEAVPLFETKSSLDHLPEMIAKLPLTRLHIGLNDLHLDMGLTFMFETIADGTLEAPCAALRAAGIPFGIGGVARAKEGIVSPEYLLGEHVRLGSSGAILSRTFHRGSERLEDLQREMDFADEIDKLRAIYDRFMQADTPTLDANRAQTSDRISDVVHLIKQRSSS